MCFQAFGNTEIPDRKHQCRLRCGKTASAPDYNHYYLFVFTVQTSDHGSSGAPRRRCHRSDAAEAIAPSGSQRGRSEGPPPVLVPLAVSTHSSPVM